MERLVRLFQQLITTILAATNALQLLVLTMRADLHHRLVSPPDALDLLTAAVKKAGHVGKIKLAIGPAAS